MALSDLAASLDPNDLISRYTAIEIANTITRSCQLLWEPRLSYDKSNFDTIRMRFSTINQFLDTISILPLDVSPEFKLKQIGYCGEVKGICNDYSSRLKKDLSFYGYAPRGANEESIYLAKYGLCVTALNDMSEAIRKGNQTKSGATAQQLYLSAREKRKLWYSSLAQKVDIQNKNPFEMSDGYWSFLEIEQPTIPGDQDTLYSRIATGHPDAWKLCFSRIQLSLEYLNNLRNSRGFLRKTEDPYWRNRVCLPRLIFNLTKPELVKEIRFGQDVSLVQPGIVTTDETVVKDKPKETKPTYVS